MKVPRRSSRSLLSILALALVAVAAISAPAQAAVPDGQLNVLLFYKPNFHASNVQARQAVRDLATQLGTQYNQPVNIQETDDPAAFTTANLATKDTVVFAQTGGVLFNASQRSALEAYIRGGGGYMGLHYAAWSVGESEHDVNPFYARLVGAVSEGHPGEPRRPARSRLRQGRRPPAHPGRDGLDHPQRRMVRLDRQPGAQRPHPDRGGRVLVRRRAQWNVPPGHVVSDDRLSGRSWYSSMGHEGTAYSESYMRAQMKNGLAYAAGLLTADCSPPGEGPGRRLEPGHAVAPGADQHGADLGRQGAVVRQRRRLGHRHHPVRLVRQQLGHPGRPDGGRRLGSRRRPAPWPT